MQKYYQPTKIHFGLESLNLLPEIVSRYGKKIFLVTTPDEPLKPIYTKVKDLLKENDISCIHFDKVVPNPTSEMIEDGFSLLNEAQCDVIVALGGGSSIDTAKILSLTYGKDNIEWDYLFTNFDSPYVDYPTYNTQMLPLITIPTTSGTGSQVTQAAVVSRGKDKLTVYHPDCFAKECILDPDLVKTLPLRMSMATGFDAFTHAFESYLNVHHSVYSRFDSINALKLIVEHLPKLHDDLSDLEHRKAMSLADTLAGKALANSGADVPHPLSEIIGGITHMTHGCALACVFVPFLEVMGEKHKKNFDELAHILDPNLEETADGSKQLAQIVRQFMASIEMDITLSSMGVTKEDFDLICQSPVLHHLPFATYEECLAILNKAYA